MQIVLIAGGGLTFSAATLAQLHTPGIKYIVYIIKPYIVSFGSGSSNYKALAKFLICLVYYY
jgi:hypothetical protein